MCKTIGEDVSAFDDGVTCKLTPVASFLETLNKQCQSNTIWAR